jgi:cobalt-zinc-cadmium efflux system outer membrane protein
MMARRGAFHFPAWLEEALGLAEQHADLRELTLLAEAARGRSAQGGQWPNPEASLRFESAPFDSPGDGDLLAGFSQRWPVGGRLGAASAVGAAEERRLQALHAAKRFERRTKVRAAFAVALHLTAAEAAYGELRSATVEGVRIAQALLAAGEGVTEDVARARLESLRAEVELDRLRAQKSVALAALSTEIGTPALVVERVTGDPSEILGVPALESLIQSIANHPESAAASADVAVQRAKIALAEAERIPDLNVDLLYRRIGATKDGGFDVGLGVAIPLFDRNQGRLREARAEEGAARAREAGTATRLAAEAREAHARLAAAVAVARRYERELVPASAEVLKGAEARYARGDISLAEVLPARRDHALVRLAWLDAIREARVDHARLAELAR